MSVFPALANFTAEVVPYSTAMSGMCAWTASTTGCVATIVPLLLIVPALFLAVAVACLMTPQRSVLERPIAIHQSPLIPLCYRGLEPRQLLQLVAPIVDVPLKVFLPRVGLADLVRPCAGMGVASLKELLRMNVVAHRDVGIGTKETRVLQRAIERRIKTREVAIKRAAGLR